MWTKSKHQMQSCMLPYIILNDLFVFVTNGALLKEKNVNLLIYWSKITDTQERFIFTPKKESLLRI